MRRRVFPAASIALLTLAACSSTTGQSPMASNPQSQPAACTPGAGCDQVFVSVRGPADWTPATDYVLEIGSVAFRVDHGDGGGVASITTLAPVGVRLVRPADCVVLIAFDAQPGSRWTIRFDSQERPTAVQLREDQVMALGPGLAEGTLSGCPLPTG